MNGLHLTADLRGCQCPAHWLTHSEPLRTLARSACEQAGLTVVSEHWHRFQPADEASGAQSGFTGVLLLAQSHLALHTWPELSGATLDVYVCNYGADDSGKARAVMDRMLVEMRAERVERHAVSRGGLA